MDPSMGPSLVGDRAPSPPATPRHKSAGAVPCSVLRLPRLHPPDGGQPPSFTEDKHEMAWHDNVVIDQDLARLVVARERATRAPAVPADIENNIRHPPADFHARARRGREAKRKTPPDIVNAGRPTKEQNRIATRGVPTVYPDAMNAVCDRERAQRDMSFVPRTLARHAPDTPSQVKHTSLMHPQPLAEVHPFTPTLRKWRHGIPVDCGPDWNWDVITAAVAHGPHPTARTQDSITLFAEDIEYQVKAGFCKVYQWDELQKMRPANLKISPVAVIPQVGHRCRIILDLSFPVYQDLDGIVTITPESVNDTTVLQAPSDPVKEIGWVLPRLLQYMRDTPAGLHLLFCKVRHQRQLLAPHRPTTGQLQLCICPPTKGGGASADRGAVGSANGLGREPILVLHSYRICTRHHPTPGGCQRRSSTSPNRSTDEYPARAASSPR